MLSYKANLNRKKKHFLTTAFTLVELMITVTIIGLLAAVAIPSYQKYILKSKMSEGLLELRHVHDRQIIFVATPITYRDATHGDVQCRSELRFATACMYIDNDDGNGLYQGVPSRKKAKQRAWFGYPKDYSATSYNPTTRICTGTGIAPYTDPQLLFEGVDYSNSASGNEYNWIEATPGYFAIRAWPNNSFAAEVGVSSSESTIIWALSDLDGDFVGDGSNYSFGCGTHPATSDKITGLGRGMYYKDGEIESSAGIIRVNVGE